MTAHIKANKGDFAKVVLMPGDPLRAKWIAENYLKDSVLVNSVRGMLAYTGTYNGVKISVMGHGMGIPSIGIYAYELFNFFDVELIVRIGSAGAYSKNVKLGDLLLVEKAYSNSFFAKDIGLDIDKKFISSNKKLNNYAIDVANFNKVNLKKIIVHSSDTFYSCHTLKDLIKETKAEAVEMEAFALFALAQKFNKKAICLLTCSDSLVTKEAMKADDRVTSFGKMIDLALKIVEKIIV